MASLESRVTELEQRLLAAEQALTTSVSGNRGGRHILEAPLQVVGSDGATLAEIGTGTGGHARLTLFNKAGSAVAAMGADGCGGYLTFHNAAGERVGYFTVEAYGSRLEINGLDGGGVTIYNDFDGGGIQISHVGGHIGIELHTDIGLAKLRVYEDQTDEPVLTLP